MEKIKAFLMQAPAATAILEGAELVFILANPQCQVLLGKTEDELLGHPLRDFFDEEDQRGLVSFLKKAYRNRSPLHGSAMPVKVRSDKGKTEMKYFDFLIQPINNEENEFNGIIAHAVDVTEQVMIRKNIQEKEEALKKTREQLELSVHAGRFGLWHWDLTNNIFSWNREQLEIFGLPGLEWRTPFDTFFSFVLPEDRQNLYAGLLNPSRLSDHQHDFRIKRKDGSIRNLRSRTKTFYDNNKQPLYVTGLMIDITEQLEAEQKIKFAGILTDSMADAVIATGTSKEDFRITSWNKGAETIYGWKAEEVVGKRSMEILRSERTQEEANALYESLKTGHWQGEVIQYHKTGYPIYIQASLAMVNDNEGKPIGVVAVNRDITERKKAEQKIFESEEFNRNILQNSPDCYKILDTEGRIESINQHGMGMLELEEISHVRGKHWWEFWDPEYHSLVVEAINNAKLGLSTQFQAYCRTFKGTGKWWDVVVSSVGTPASGIRSIIAVSRDITEQKKASEKIRQSEERYRQLAASLEEKVAARTAELTRLYNDNIRQMEELQKALEADQMKSDFIKMASHELKTPITSVKGYIQLLLSMLSEKKPPGIEPALLETTLNSVEKQVNRIIRLLSELLDLSKIESGQLTLNQEKFCLNRLIEETVQDVLHIHTDHTISIQSSLDVALYADKDRLSQVLINLLSNAIKYSPDKKVIELNISQVENKVRVSVKDQGIGINEDELSKVFNRFYRASGASEQTYPGFGIGLFIAREIIERHGGTITVKSKKNEGAEFIFELPLTIQEEKTQSILSAKI